jgi:hypothetical protein
VATLIADQGRRNGTGRIASMPASLLFAVTWAGLPPTQALERALDAVEPPPAMRAAFHATLTSGNAVRRIEYDPYIETGDKFRITYSWGTNDELDAVVEGWKAEKQADSRLFADDLRASLAEAHIAGAPDSMAVAFKHRMSLNDGPLDAEFSTGMSGRMQLDLKTGYVAEIDYRIDRPITLDDGTKVEQYRQSYTLGYSERWGVSYVMAYEVYAKGGRWGLSEERTIKVELTDIAFGLAGDGKQDLASHPAEYATGPTALLR